MMTIVIIVTCVTAGTPFNSALLTPWMKATLVDFYFNVFVLSVSLTPAELFLTVNCKCDAGSWQYLLDCLQGGIAPGQDRLACASRPFLRRAGRGWSARAGLGDGLGKEAERIQGPVPPCCI
eukprot:2189420-Rhodomonas_salina.2